ncbi:molybdenum cofactor guanylyltransferase MobA [Marinimicrobium sp. ABcell2]|uniref:molybdenum cofactor guanylyltransferase MobA n=1 Tax=Marinimicrobium sp. ABcell2 TaxID=3069751 RepID=UPI0027AE121E|nr:molybdenum cofactor guanylyltransferase MobA [Marinimicrobium sp. ABcell2]MDQ2075357.1 molybdenum cofactor guanylyltransferase MobA [Marinimicrobium sp. ABcell2]
MTTKDTILGILLAGGQARRMGGGDKCLLPLAGKTLLQRTIDRAQPQVDQLLLSANGSSLRFARSRLTVLPDEKPDFPGPLAGIQTGLSWLHAHRPDCQWLASFASDTPFFPSDLVDHLLRATQESGANLAVASSEGRLHPTFALWHRSLLDPVSKALTGDVSPRLQEWVRQQECVEVDFPSVRYDAFFNINHPQDLYQAETLLPFLEESN